MEKNLPILYINKILELPELQIHKVISTNTQEVHLEGIPVAYLQTCPICHSEQDVKWDGQNKQREIWH